MLFHNEKDIWDLFDAKSIWDLFDAKSIWDRNFFIVLVLSLPQADGTRPRSRICISYRVLIP